MKTRYRVCRVIDEDHFGTDRKFELMSIENPEFLRREDAIRWIEELDANHQYSSYTILEVFTKE
jgi:hypothetical protein